MCAIQSIADERYSSFHPNNCGEGEYNYYERFHKNNPDNVSVRHTKHDKFLAIKSKLSGRRMESQYIE
jgi:hypothetical protein